MATIDYEKMKEDLEAAQTDTTPFVIPDSEVTVVGDANKTEINAHDFEITFRIPQEMEDGTIKQVKKTQEYKGVYITPRLDRKLSRLIASMMPYFKKANDDGTVSDYTQEELAKISKDFEGEILDMMYDVVGELLGIHKELRQYMMVDSVEASVTKIFRQIPELINEGETFFG